MRNKLQFVLFLLPILLFGHGFDTVADAFRKGKFSNELQEIHFLYQEWRKNGRFQEVEKYWRENREKIAPEQERMRVRLLEIEDQRNALLQEVADDHPTEEISQLILEIIKLSNLSKKHVKALDFMAHLDAGRINTYGDPHLGILERILHEYKLKVFLVESLLTQGRLSPGTAKFYQILLALEKDRAIGEYQEQVPLLKEALLVNEVQYRVAYEDQSLTDLLNGMRAPQNLAEEKVKQILRYFKIRISATMAL